MKQRRVMLGVVSALILIGAAAAVGLWSMSGRATIVVASKNFTESRILAEIMAQLIHAETGLAVDRRELGSTSLCYDALSKGAIHLYPEYSGTLLTEILKQDPVSDPQETISRVSELLAQGNRFQALAPFGLNDTYVLAMRKERAEALGIRTISEVKAHPHLRAGFTAEFNQRPDGYPGLEKHYGLKFERQPVDLAPGHMYGAVAGGQVDVISAFSTDANIQKFDLTLLRDDKQFFPAYEALPLIRNDLAASHPAIIECLKRLAGSIDDAAMLRLNYRVEIDGVPVKEVARQFLASLAPGKKGESP